MKVVSFEGWHLEWIDFNSDAFQFTMQLPMALIDHGKVLASVGTSYSGLRGGKIVACAGVIPLWNGVADLWMYLGKDTFRKKKQACEIIGYFMEKCIEEYDLHRLQATVKSDYREGRRFAKFFGFKEEGEMIGYGPDKQNFIRVAKII